MTDDERIRALIAAVHEWRDELAGIEASQKADGLSRDQRILLEGDHAVLKARIHRANTIIANYDLIGFTREGRQFFAREVGDLQEPT